MLFSFVPHGQNGFCVAALSLVLFVVGCTGRPSRVKPPAIDPDQAGQSAMTEYDQDGDGVLSTEELDQCPAVKGALASYDTNGDQSVSGDEIAARIRAWQETKVGLASMGCTVLLNGRPLEGATVKFVPESFLGEAIKTASGTTQATGRASISVAEADLPSDQKGLTGAQLGAYKVEITHPTRNIPPMYNTQTTLGQEIFLNAIEANIVFDLRG